MERGERAWKGGGGGRTAAAARRRAIPLVGSRRLLLLLVLLLLGVATGFTIRFLTFSEPARVDSNGLPLSPVSYDALKSRPEANLLFPGARVFHREGGSEHTTLDGDRNPAFAGAIMTTSAPAQNVYAWYEQELQASGWTRMAVPRATTELSAMGWRRGTRERFLVAIDDPAQLSRALGSQVPANGTIVDMTYLVGPSG